MKAVTLYNKGMYLVNGIPAETAPVSAEDLLIKNSGTSTIQFKAFDIVYE